MKQIYLDACVLVAHFAKNREKERHKIVLDALKVFSQISEVRLCTSHWAVAEMVKVLILRLKFKNKYVLQCEAELLNKMRLGEVKIEFIDVSNKKEYDFKEFFYDVRKGILRYNSGVGDTIHSVIMKNNKIKGILTFDEKEDFKKIPGLVVIHPKEIAKVKAE
jgi:predicted nucleic acid-binding protein